MFHINELVAWQKKVLEHGPTWCIAVGSLFLLLGLFPYLFDAWRHRKTFAISKAFFILWGIGCLCMTGNAAMYYIRDIINKSGSSGSNGNGTQTPEWMLNIKYLSFGGANLLAAFANFYAFFVKRRNVIESRKLGITEEKYWETMVKYNYGDAVAESAPESDPIPL